MPQGSVNRQMQSSLLMSELSFASTIMGYGLGLKLSVSPQELSMRMVKNLMQCFG